MGGSSDPPCPPQTFREYHLLWPSVGEAWLLLGPENRAHMHSLITCGRGTQPLLDPVRWVHGEEMPTTPFSPFLFPSPFQEGVEAKLPSGTPLALLQANWVFASAGGRKIGSSVSRYHPRGTKCGHLLPSQGLPEGGKLASACPLKPGEVGAVLPMVFVWSRAGFEGKVFGSHRPLFSRPLLVGGGDRLSRAFLI